MIVRSICNYFELIKNKCYVVENYDNEYYFITLSENRCLKNEIDGLNRIIEETEKEKEELNNKFEDLSEKYKAKKKACDYWFDKYTLNQEKLNKLFEDEIIIIQYLDKKLNLLIDQNAPECMKTLIQNLIDELIVKNR